MYIAIDRQEIIPRDFFVCEFYGTETCFCWNADKLVRFPYKANDKSAHNVQVLSTPTSVRRVQCFDGRVFVICMPQGIYKLSRSGVFALLSKNAFGIGANYWEVFTSTEEGIHLDNKQIKSSKLLFQCAVESRAEEIYTFSLILEDTQEQFLGCFNDNRQAEKNLCLIGHGRKLFALNGDQAQLIYTVDVGTILYIAPVKQRDKVAALLLLVNLDTVVLVHKGDSGLFFEKVRLGRNVQSASTLCASFSAQSENVLWIVYCDQSKLYYVKKVLFTDIVQEVKVEERTFTCIQHYRSNVILALSEGKRLVELSFEAMEVSSLIDNNCDLHSNMFRGTDPIMDKICKKVLELDILWKKLADEQDKLRRINLCASEWKLQTNPHVEISKLWNHHYLTLNVSGKLPKNSYLVFAFICNNQNTFYLKEITETTFEIKMPINKDNILYSSTIEMDLITLMNEEAPWCLIRNFIDYPLQKEIRKTRPKKDNTAFINAKIASLQNLIIKGDLDMTKLSEIKKIIRAEL